MTINSFERVRKVRKKFETELLNLDNVVGVGIGLRQKGGVYTGEVALIVMVKKKMNIDEVTPDNLIPAALDGVTVDVQEVGEIHASSK
jgi:hypothetical protein